MRRVVALLMLALLALPASAALDAGQLAVIINDADPASVEIGTYYAERRNLPPQNVIHTRFPPDKPILSSAVFKQIYAQVKTLTPETVQAYALTWANPIRVNCMSITTAFAMGYATRHCAKGCRAIAPNPYFNSASNAPYTDLKIRPTMSIAARTVDNAKLLIDRGVLADGTRPAATAYFVITPDKARKHVRRHLPRHTGASARSFLSGLSTPPGSAINSTSCSISPEPGAYRSLTPSASFRVRWPTTSLPPAAGS